MSIKKAPPGRGETSWINKGEPGAELVANKSKAYCPSQF